MQAKLGDVLEKLSPNKRYSNFIQHVSQQSFQLTQNKVRGMPTNSARERSLNNSQLCTERHWRPSHAGAPTKFVEFSLFGRCRNSSSSNKQNLPKEKMQRKTTKRLLENSWICNVVAFQRNEVTNSVQITV